MSDDARRAQRVVLALGAGAARGLASVGVLQGLEEDGIEVAGVAGTSMGSIVGGLFAQGVSPSEMSQLFEAVDWPKVGRVLLGSVVGEAFHDLLREMMGDVAIEDLGVPYAAVCCDLDTGERIDLRAGSLADAARASSAIPGLLSPLRHAGRTLVDGTVAEPVPVSAAAVLAEAPVLAVNATRLAPRIRVVTSASDVRAEGSAPRRLSGRLERWLRGRRVGPDGHDVGLPRRWEVAMRAFEIMQDRLARGCRQVDMVEPDVAPFGWFDFERSQEIVAAGHHAYRRFRDG
jgi:NTE family protein